MNYFNREKYLSRTSLAYIAISTLLLSASFSYAQTKPAIDTPLPIEAGIPEGTYRGKYMGTEKGHAKLFTQKIRGCHGCFVAILFRTSEKDTVQAYKTTPQNAGMSEYLMTPLASDQDGYLTTPNENPSYVLSITSGLGTEDVKFDMSSANSGNTRGGDGTISFNHGEGSSYDIDEGKAGHYRGDDSRREIGTIHMVETAFADGSHTATVTWDGNKGTNLGAGNYSLKEAAPGVFTFNSLSYYATGTKLQDIPKKLVVFIKHHHREWALLVDPANPAIVDELRIKRN